MKKWIVISSLFLVACAKQEQLQETSFTCSVEDVTTGTMTEKAGVYLYEYHTPAMPFSNISRNVIEYFEVDYGSSFSYEFNAKRGNGYEYILEFDDSSGDFLSGLRYEGFSYQMVSQCTLSKKENVLCSLRVEPTAQISLDATNPLPDARENDSIWLQITDGKIRSALSCSGIGGCAEGGGEIPHGWYEYSYQIFREGIKEENHVESLYIKYRSDTSLFVTF